MTPTIFTLATHQFLKGGGKVRRGILHPKKEERANHTHPIVMNQIEGETKNIAGKRMTEGEGIDIRVQAAHLEDQVVAMTKGEGEEGVHLLIVIGIVQEEEILEIDLINNKHSIL